MSSTPRAAAVDANDRVYDHVTAAVRTALDQVEPAVQKELESLVAQALQLNDALFLDWLITIRQLDPQEAHHYAARFQTYRTAHWR